MIKVTINGKRIPDKTSNQSHSASMFFWIYSTEHIATNTHIVPVNAACKMDIDVKANTTVIQTMKMIMPALTCFGRLLIFSHSKRFEKIVMFLIVC